MRAAVDEPHRPAHRDLHACSSRSGHALEFVPLTPWGLSMPVDWAAAYAKGVEADIDQLKKDLQPLEAGTMRVGERVGNGAWTDVTQEAIDRNKRAIATYEAILKDVRENRMKG